MKFKDLIGDLMVGSFGSDIATTQILLTMFFAVAAGLYVFAVYRMKSRAAFYSKDFSHTLAILPVITAGVVLTMQSSLVVSLGMVGALSVVRFRNAVKNTMDLAFLFWSISLGIIVGAGIFEIALVVSLVITVMVLLLDVVPAGRPPYILALHAQGIDYASEIEPLLKKYVRHYRVKSRAVCAQTMDLMIELKTNQESALLDELAKNPHICRANLLSHDGELRM